MPSTFNVNRAAGYEQLMGRFSRKLALPFIDFAGLADGERIVDVGCGTGSLTFALAEAADLRGIAAVDLSPVFVAEARRRNTDPRIDIEEADACALPFEAGTFDRALSLLVLHFVPEPARAIAEMRRVVRPGGTVAACVWDHFGGLPGMRMFWDTAAMLGAGGRAARSRYLFQPMMEEGEMKTAFAAEGLHDVEETALSIRMEYAGFADYFDPIAAGEGPLGKYFGSLDDGGREALELAVRDAYEGGRPDGPRSFAAVAWACRGTVAA